jgi:hypothetical protein
MMFPPDEYGPKTLRGGRKTNAQRPGARTRFLVIAEAAIVQRYGAAAAWPGLYPGLFSRVN